MHQQACERSRGVAVLHAPLARFSLTIDRIDSNGQSSEAAIAGKKFQVLTDHSEPTNSDDTRTPGRLTGRSITLHSGRTLRATATRVGDDRHKAEGEQSRCSGLGHGADVEAHVIDAELEEAPVVDFREAQ